MDAQLIVHPVARRSMAERTHRFGSSAFGRTNPTQIEERTRQQLKFFESKRVWAQFGFVRHICGGMLENRRRGQWIPALLFRGVIDDFQKFRIRP